jgi:hypothetical protein
VADWKRTHANEAEKAWENEMVQNVLTEFAGNMGFKREGLPEYGLSKIVSYVAQVARAEALGFDPMLLRLTPQEADQSLLRLAEIAAETGKPIWAITDEQVGEDRG